MTGSKKSPVFLASLCAVAGLMLTLTAEAKQFGSSSTDASWEEVEHYLYFMREEEQLARDTYLYLNDEWGEETPVFLNISASEQRHMDAMERLLEKYGLEGPVIDGESRWSDPGNLFVYADGWASGDYIEEEDLNLLIGILLGIGRNSKEEGVIVGALIEETDIIDIQHGIEASAGYDDIVKVYESLMCGSRNHLRGFWSNLEAMGMAGYYFENHRILSAEEFNGIVYGAYEDCGTNTRNRGH